MNIKGIIMFLAVITGVYFLWTWISRSESNPLRQGVFGTNPPIGEGEIVYPQDQGYESTNPDVLALEAPIAGDIPTSNPEDTMRYETVYNILVEAPVIPEMDTQGIIDDLAENIAAKEDAPIQDNTGSPAPTPKKKKKSYNKAIAEKKAIDLDPVNQFMRVAQGKEVIYASEKQEAEMTDPNESRLGRKVYITTSQGTSLITRSGR